MNSSRSASRKVAFAMVAALLGALVLPTFGASPASADTAPVTTAEPVTISSDALPTTQVNGVVWAQVVVGSTVYVTGEFTSARPAGASAGANETPRADLLAYNIETGALVSTWAPTLNAQGRTIAASADGTRIFVGGDFTEVSGVAKNRIVALDATTGAVIKGFGASVNSTVNAIAVAGNTLYAGGLFATAGGVTRTRLAAFDTTTGDLTDWAPTTDRQVLSMTTVPSQNKVIVGGRMTVINGTAAIGMGAIDATTGATLSWPINTIVKNSGDNTGIWSLRSDSTNVYITGYTFGSGGNLESSAVADLNGNLVWVSGCLGDTYDSYPLNGVLYTVSHAHNCSQVSGHPEVTPRAWQRAVAFSIAPSGTNVSGAFAGRPAPKELSWAPTLDGGSYTGQDQAAWTVTGNAKYVVMGGEFPKVNGTAQAGLVRMAIREVAPNTDGPRAFSADPTVTSPAPGTVAVSWKSTWDRDNGTLYYDVLRGDTVANSIVVARVSGASTFWNLPTLSASDRTASGGTTQTYRVRARDAYGNTSISSAVSVAVTAGTAPSSNYSAAVLGSGASNYWRFGEASGTSTADQVGGTPMTLAAGQTRGVTGALTGDTDAATSFTGSDTAPAGTRTAVTAPGTFTEEVWFKTGSTRGGKLVGFGNSSTGSSSTSDRHLYLANNGQLYFGVLSSAAAKSTINSSASYNNNAWHFAAATFSPGGGAKLYVDGALVASSATMNTSSAYSGYWRVAGDSLSTGSIFNQSNWPAKPSSTSLAGTIDEVAVYPTEQTAAAVAQHYAVGKGQAVNLAPVARATYTSAFRTVTLDGSTSSDADGTVASYAWNFGDGSTGTGARPNHTYATTGTFGVTLTVTDDGGATSSTQLTVATSTPQNVSPTASFTSSVSNLTANFDATASADPDGSIASYAWNFGDGSTGTGVKPSHLYPAAGVYAVTLTVSDNQGATAGSAGQVTVTVPGGPATTVAADTFARTTAAGLGSAEVGGAWTATSNTTTSVADGSARFSTAAGKTISARLNAVSSTDTDLSFSTWTDPVPTAAVYLTGIVRGTAAGDYRGRVKVDANGTVSASITRGTGSTETAIGSTAAVPGLTYTAGSKLRVRVQATGSSPTTIRMKVWADGTAEPGAWTREVTDATDGFQVAGSVGIYGYSSSSATAVAVQRFDDLRATAGTAATNQPPVAAFTSSAADLAVSFDGSGSTDADGPIATYAWDFGDGSNGTGAKPAHTYATAGTYPVKLTVTDAAGATTSVTKSVVVTTQAPVTTLAADDFGRTVATGWGSAQTGGAWTTTGTGVTWSVDGSSAVATANAGKRGQAVLAGVSAPDTDVSHVESLDALPTGAGAYLATNVRSTTAGDYRVRVRYLATGAVAAGVYYAQGGTETVIGSQTTIPGLTYTAGTKLHVRAQATGSSPTTIRYRIWVDGTTEPTTWTSVTDSTTGMQVAGTVGFNVYSTSSATAAVVARFDDLVTVKP